MTDSAIEAPSPAIVRRASLAGFLGTIVEAYDFFVYTYLIVYTAPLFFPSDDRIVGVLSSLLVLGSGFLTRPLGGLFFGRLGDRKGRRITLMITILGMGAATAAMGLLPTYEAIGIAAPALLVVFRLSQGFAAGGELAGSTTFVSEHSTKNNHGLLSTITPLGFSAGTAIAPAVVAVFAALLSEDVMGDWGWRIPMLLSIPLTLTCLLLRLGLEDSPEFKRLSAARQVPRTPVRDLITGYWPQLVKVTLLSATVLMIGYIVAAFLPLFLQDQAGFAAGTTAAMASIAGVAAIVFTIVAGLVIDRLGRRNLMFVVLGALAVLFYPILSLMQASDGNFAVALLGFAVLGGLGGAAASPAYAALTATFPARVRYTGAALGFGLGSAIGGGFGPWLSAKLTATTGNIYSPAFLAIGAALIGIAVIATLPSREVSGDDGEFVVPGEGIGTAAEKVDAG
ncbi:MFS transporter [Gordonia rubripertincta]|uniref:MFS transporter n=1 Tax=Gordonia rubripertincta TaxID=36822 RepID=UPI0015F88A08|nr:MFS transporter [Gordonia rubripertincta]QMU21014.1 MFS transporter [Gordonia rubripertincta]